MKPRSTPEGLLEQAGSSLNLLKGTSTLNLQKEFQRNYNKKIIDLLLICLQLRMLDTVTVKYWINATNLRLLLINPFKIQEVMTTSEVASGDRLGELKCLLCTENDTQENLIEAIINYATKKKLNDCNRTPNLNHLFRKRTLNHLAKLTK